MGNFQELDVWKIAKELAIYIYEVTNKSPFSKDFGLRDQIRRATVSISSNISEGDESGTNKMSIRYFYIAKASNAEVQTQAIITNDIGYISDTEKENIISICEKISKKLYRLIQYRSQYK
ncbi:MAG: four helix bundle protein [Candidatus Marinimicrobia bacterium]|nr:four helix bundle protein [Candidatus Neomarinimicrobiota bacterium]